VHIYSPLLSASRSAHRRLATQFLAVNFCSLYTLTMVGFNGVLLKLSFFFLCLNFPTTLAAGDDRRFIYSGFAGSDIIVNGLAEVTPNGLLHLTNGTAQLKGQAFHPTPLHFCNQSLDGTVQSFSAAFVFAIRSIAPGMSAHGLTFFISPTKNMSSAFSNQFLGLLSKKNNGNSSNHIFAVELDTVLSSDLLDADDNHVGIDINDLRSVKSHYAGYYDDTSGNFHNLTLASFEAMQVWVDYDGGRRRIDVTLAPLQMAKPKKPLVSTTYDLSTVLKDRSYVGFSSSTGILGTRITTCLAGVLV
jgi:hypothetical protein